MRTATKIFALLGLFVSFVSAIVSPDFSLSQTISQPANPDTMFCNTRGSIATRLANRWQCLTPGTSGQVLKTNGPGADAGWLTVTGTGTVSSVDMTVPSFLAVSGNPITTAGTLAVTAPSASQNFVLAAPSASAGSPTMRALVGADIPAINLAGTGNGGITGTLPLTNIPTITVAKGGTNATSASGTALDNITGFAGTGILRRTGAGTYTQGTTVSVAEGGTNATSAGGTALDNISGFATTGVISRTGAATYSIATIPATLGSQTANFIFAAPDGSAGNPAFRAMTSNDIPSSVALAGNPTTTTQAANNNSTRIATTAYVDAAVSTVPGGPTYTAKTGDTSLTSSLTDDPTLQFAMAASTRYFIDGEIYYQVAATGATGGINIAYDLPGTANKVGSGCEGVDGTTLFAGHAETTTSGKTTFCTSPTPQATRTGHIHISVEVDNGVTAGTFALSFNVTGAGSTGSTFRGSHISYKIY
jgi:hypothetical protein